MKHSTAKRSQSVTFEIDQKYTGSSSSMDILSSNDSLHNSCSENTLETAFDAQYVQNQNLQNIQNLQNTQISPINSGNFRRRSGGLIKIKRASFAKSLDVEISAEQPDTMETLRAERNRLLCEAGRLHETNQRLCTRNSQMKAQITKAKCDIDRKDDDIEVWKRCVAMLGQDPGAMFNYVAGLSDTSSSTGNGTVEMDKAVEDESSSNFRKRL